MFDGTIFRTTTAGLQVTAILHGLFTPADLGYDATRDRLPIPSLFGDFVTTQPLR